MYIEGFIVHEEITRMVPAKFAILRKKKKPPVKKNSVRGCRRYRNCLSGRWFGIPNKKPSIVELILGCLH